MVWAGAPQEDLVALGCPDSPPPPAAFGAVGGGVKHVLRPSGGGGGMLPLVEGKPPMGTYWGPRPPSG